MTVWPVPHQGLEPAKVHDRRSIDSPTDIGEIGGDRGGRFLHKLTTGLGPVCMCKWEEDGSPLQRRMPAFKMLQKIVICGYEWNNSISGEGQLHN